MRRIDGGPARPEIRNMGNHDPARNEDTVDLLDQPDQIWNVLEHLVGVDNLELFVGKGKTIVQIGHHIHAREPHLVQADGSRKLVSSAADIEDALARHALHLEDTMLQQFNSRAPWPFPSSMASERS